MSINQARAFVAVVAVTVLATAPARADVSIDLRAKDPVAALPAVSADGTNFLRPYRRWRTGCKRADLHVEFGGIDRSVAEPEYSSAPLIGGCGEAIDAYQGNVAMINESLRDTQCSTAPRRGSLIAKLPASLVADGLRVDVTATADSAHVMINKLERVVGAWTGSQRVQVSGTPLEVRGWYIVDHRSTHEIAILVSVREADGTIAERWVDVWLDTVARTPGPVDVARTWMLALAEGDATALAATTLTPVVRVGSAGPPARYAALYDGEEFVKITSRQIPAELKAHKKALSRPGLTLVQFTADDAAGAVVVVLGVKKGKVAVVAEATTPGREP